MATDWTLPYTATYRLVLVDRSTGTETEAGDVLVEGGTVERNDSTTSKESADVTVVGDFSPDPMLVRLYADVSQGGEVEAVALGTFVANVDKTYWDGAASTSTVSLDGRLSELAGDAFEAPFTVEAGTPAVAYAAQIAEEAGFTVVSDASTYTLSQARSYSLDEEQSKLDVVNDLLDLAGFSSARTDPMGNVVLAVYQEPEDRPVAASYASGGASVLRRDVSEETDSSEVANVVLAVYSTQDGTVVGTAVDDDPTSRWSTAARGRRIVKRYSYSDLVEQEEADAKAASLLATAQSVVRKVTYTAPYDPGVELASAVELDYPEAGVSGKFAVRTQRVTLDEAMQVETEARVYVRG